MERAVEEEAGAGEKRQGRFEGQADLTIRASPMRYATILYIASIRF